jgi:EAL domain-containing protein (putative c-di-GMP-specific phosphodiesterase class I)/ActR/RegA family two-component response regulator
MTETTTGPDYTRLRILIVDDDQLMIDLLGRVIRRLGPRSAMTANDGASGLIALNEGTYDIAFCDIDMPGMDGVEFLRHLGSRPDPPAVVVISSTADVVLKTVEEIGLAHRLRVLGALRKPAAIDDVRAVFDAFLAGTAPAPSGHRSPNVELHADEVLDLLPDFVEVHYQPIHEAATGSVRSIEALARLRHPRLGLIGPSIFVPILERNSASTLLLRSVLRRALPDLATLRAEIRPSLHMAINISAEDLSTPDIVAELSAWMADAELPLDALTLELTETRIVRDTALPVEILTRLRVRGMQLAIDDYGTGFASLKQLKRIPFTELKIDRTFVSNAHRERRTREMLASTIALAHKLDLLTVAEGVETEEELNLVRTLGCDFAQGFLLSNPMPFDVLRDYLTSAT